MTTTLSIAVSPLGAPRMTQQDRWRHRPVIDRYFTYRAELQQALPNFQLPVSLSLTFFMPMPNSWSNKKRMAYLGKPHDAKPDIDNLCKAFMDAFGSDQHVAILHAEKYWSDIGSIDLIQEVQS